MVWPVARSITYQMFPHRATPSSADTREIRSNCVSVGIGTAVTVAIWGSLPVGLGSLRDLVRELYDTVAYLVNRLGTERGDICGVQGLALAGIDGGYMMHEVYTLAVPDLPDKRHK